MDSGHYIQYRSHYYRMLDKRGMQVHYRRGTKTMVIRSLDGDLFCCVNDSEIHALEEIPERVQASASLDPVPERTEPGKRYIPPMVHPWCSKTFWKFVKTQAHHLMDDLPA